MTPSFMQPSDGAHVVVATQGSWDQLVTLDALCRSRGTHFIAAVSFAEAYSFRSLEQQQFSITSPHVQGKGHVGKVACRVEFLGNKKMHIKTNVAVSNVWLLVVAHFTVSVVRSKILAS
jgi:hypothetical protein